MRVKPACELPLLSLENGGKMVIVNKQVKIYKINKVNSTHLLFFKNK